MRMFGFGLTVLTLAMVSGLAGSSAATAKTDRFAHCLTLPLQGVHVVNGHSMALIDRSGRVALLDLSSGCLEGKIRQLDIVMARSAGILCNRTDIDDIVNVQDIHGGMSSDGKMSAFIDLSPHCVAKNFMIVGNVDKDGFLIGEGGRRMGNQR